MLLRLAESLKKEHGLTLAQYEALLALVQTPGGALNATELARQLQYSSGSATHLISRLESLGYVSRTKGMRDARTQQVSIAEVGAEVIARATEAHVAALSEEFEPLIAADDVEPLLSFARRLAAHEGVRSAPPVC